MKRPLIYRSSCFVFIYWCYGSSRSFFYSVSLFLFLFFAGALFVGMLGTLRFVSTSTFKFLAVLRFDQRSQLYLCLHDFRSARESNLRSLRAEDFLDFCLTTRPSGLNRPTLRFGTSKIKKINL